jgi:hypothetical protein
VNDFDLHFAHPSVSCSACGSRFVALWEL